MTTQRQPTRIDRRTRLLLAALADADLRTVDRAVEYGIAAVKGAALRDRLSAEAKRLGVSLGESQEPAAR